MSVNKVVWDRVKDQCCVNCGSPLISPKDSELLMCSVCLKDGTAAAMKQIRNIKSRSGNVKKIRIKFNPKMVNYKGK